LSPVYRAPSRALISFRNNRHLAAPSDFSRLREDGFADGPLPYATRAPVAAVRKIAAPAQEVARELDLAHPITGD
jgi:hypothetical protein